jgi:hypothetical protein
MDQYDFFYCRCAQDGDFSLGSLCSLYRFCWDLFINPPSKSGHKSTDTEFSRSSLTQPSTLSYFTFCGATNNNSCNLSCYYFFDKRSFITPLLMAAVLVFL